MAQIVSRKSTISAVLIIIVIGVWCTSCNSTCLSCYIDYDAGYYINSTRNDTIFITANSKYYGMDTLEKYYLLGYRPTRDGASESIDIELCGDDLKRLKDKGFDVNCFLKKFK